MFDFSHPMFRPLWVRILVVAIAVGWALIELSSGNPGWALIFGAIGAVSLWGLFINYNPEPEDSE